jgi:hypothetical protein
MDHLEYIFDNDAMENLWNYWCANAPLPYCMELMANFNNVSLRGFDRGRLTNGFDVLWKRLADEKYEFADEQLIKSCGVNTKVGDLYAEISEHTYKILPIVEE